MTRAAPAGHPPAPAQRPPVFTLDADRLLATPLPASLLGAAVGLDVYALNPFRLLGVSARADDAALAGATQRFRNVLRLNPQAALSRAIRTGYQAPLAADAALESVARLSDPRRRLGFELFWPHLLGDEFDLIRRTGDVGSDEVLAELRARTTGQSEARWHHAAAIAHHNRAIATELAGAGGHEHWALALDSWGRVLGDDAFWRDLGARAEAFDDPRVGAADAVKARGELPAVLLGFPTVFARAYAHANDTAGVLRHVKALQSATWAGEARVTALAGTVRALAHGKLEPAVLRFEKDVIAVDKRRPRAEFDRFCAPLLSAAFRVRDQLTRDLGLPRDVVAQAEFDRLCEVVLKGLDTRVVYDSDDRSRALLYSLIVTRRLLELPISSAMRRRLEASVRSDAQHLYRGWADAALDPTRCWFVEGEKADPDSSLELSVYKVTSREVQVDAMRQTAGVRVRYESRKLLVPRGRDAARRHGTAAKGSVPSKVTDRSAWRWARFFAFLYAFAWGVFSLIMPVPILIVRFAVLRRIEDQRAQLPIGWLLAAGCATLFPVMLPFAPLPPRALTGLMLTGGTSLVAFGVFARRAFREAPRRALAGKPAEKPLRSPAEARSFPPFRKALAEGFREGTEPGQAEMQMTYAEREEARMKLRLGSWR